MRGSVVDEGCRLTDDVALEILEKRQESASAGSVAQRPILGFSSLLSLPRSCGRHLSLLCRRRGDWPKEVVGLGAFQEFFRVSVPVRVMVSPLRCSRCQSLR
jgi:hypothetical protein